jgi:HEPN domain-containing protein
MPEAVAEWVAIAEDDYNVARLAFDPPGYTPSYYAVCYHCQQCCEKYLKAFLLKHDTHFPKTHDLYHLLQLALPFASDWETLAAELRLVFELGMSARYPGTARADKEDAENSLALTERFRNVVRTRLL